MNTSNANKPKATAAYFMPLIPVLLYEDIENIKSTIEITPIKILSKLSTVIATSAWGSRLLKFKTFTDFNKKKGSINSII
jgi:hypothetical protein